MPTTPAGTRGAKKRLFHNAGAARPPSNQCRPCTKRVLPPGRRNRISSLSFGRFGPPTPARAPPFAVLDRGSRLAHGMSVNFDWLKRSHEGTVVAFPEAITGQAQPFASVSSCSWQSGVRAPDLQCSRPPSTSLDSSGLICATRPSRTPQRHHHGEARKGKKLALLAQARTARPVFRGARARGAARRRASARFQARSRAPCCGKSRVINREVSRPLATCSTAKGFGRCCGWSMRRAKTSGLRSGRGRKASGWRDETKLPRRPRAGPRLLTHVPWSAAGHVGRAVWVPASSEGV